MTKRNKKILTIVGISTFIALPSAVIITSAVACNGKDDSSNNSGSSISNQHDNNSESTTNDKEISFDEKKLFDSVAKATATIESKDWNKNNSNLKKAVINGLKNATNDEIKFSSFVNVKYDKTKNTGILEIKVNYSDDKNVKVKNKNSNVNLVKKDKKNKIITIQNLKLKAPTIINFNKDTLFDTVAATAKTIESKDWNQDNKKLQDSISDGLNKASNNQVSFTKFTSVSVNNNLGSVSFEIAKKASLKNYEFNFSGKTENVTFENDIFTINNLVLVSSANHQQDPVEPVIIDFDANELFDVVALVVNNKVNENDWNETNETLKNGIIQGLRSATGNKVDLNQITNTTVDTSNHNGSVSFTINKSPNEIKFINNNNNVTFNNGTFTISNLHLVPAPNVINFNVGALFNYVTSHTKEINENDWNNDNSTLKNAIIEGLKVASDNKVTLKQINNATADKTQHTGSVTFTINQDLKTLDITNKIDNVVINNNNSITINNLSLAYTPPKPEIINFDANRLFNSIFADIASINENDWNQSNSTLRNAITEGLKTATNNKLFLNQITNTTADKFQHIGSVTFTIKDTKTKIEFMSNNSNVSFSNNTVTIKNLHLVPVYIDFDINKLFNSVSSNIVSINENDWNQNNPILKNAIIESLKTATNNQITFGQITNATANKSNHTGSVTFTFNNPSNEIKYINNNANISIDRERNIVTINNLRLVPVFVNFDITNLFNSVSSRVSAIKENDWNQNDATLRNAIVEGLKSATNNQITLNQITGVTVNKSQHVGSVTFTFNKPTNEIKFLNNHNNVSINHETVIINNLHLTPVFIEFDVNKLFNTISSNVGAINEKDFNYNNPSLINAITEGLKTASNNTLTLNQINNVSINSLNHIGTISFTINNPTNEIKYISSNNNVSINQNSITINNLKLTATINVEGTNIYNALNQKFIINEWKDKTQLTNAVNQVLNDAAEANDKGKISCSPEGNPVIPTSSNSNNGSIKFKINVDQGYTVNINSNNNVWFDAKSNIVTINNLNLKKPEIININSANLYNALNTKFSTEEWNSKTELTNAINQVLDEDAGPNNKDKISCGLEGNPIVPTSSNSDNGSVKFKIYVDQGYEAHINNDNNVSFDPNSNVVTINNLNLKPGICIVVKSDDLFKSINQQFTIKEWQERTKLIDAVNQVWDDAAGPNNKDNISCSIVGDPIIPTGSLKYNGSITFRINVKGNYTIKIDDTLMETNGSTFTMNKLNLKYYVLPIYITDQIDEILNDLAYSITTRETNDELFYNHQDIVRRINSLLETVTPELRAIKLEIWNGWENQMCNGWVTFVKFGITLNLPCGDMLAIEEPSYFGYDMDLEKLISNNVYTTRYNGK